MYTEDNNLGIEKKSTGRKIAAATIIGTLGSGLLVTTVVRLFQVAQEILPWWWPWPLVIGLALFLGALLLLVPPKWWKWFRSLLTNTPRNLRIIFWLQSVLRFNEDNVYKAVKSRFLPPAQVPAHAWDFGGLVTSPLDPYFEIKLELVNTSIFELSVLGVEGLMRVDGSKCAKPPTVEKRWGIMQGDIFYVTITQSVSDSMVKRLQEAAKKQEALIFELGSISLNLDTTTKGYEGKKPNVNFNSYEIIPDKG